MNYCSDFHFCHPKKFIHEARGFATPDEHDCGVVDRFNSRVSKGDVTAFLGDFCFDTRRFREFLLALNGKFIFIQGNHDRDFMKFLAKPDPEVQAKIVSIVPGFLNTKIGDHPVTLCHFAMKSWEKSHFNAWHLHGHHHYQTDFGGKTLNVAMDCTGCFPLSDAEVIEKMATLPNNWDFIERS